MAVSEHLVPEEVPVKSALAVAVSTALTGYAPDATAQEQGASSALEEIVVTSRKREESLQDISGSIQALTGDELKRKGLQNLEDLVRFLPNVAHIGASAGENKIIFRGVSDNPNSFIAASSAAVYLDEQPLTQFAVNPEPRLVDMKRIEALAGPQGTLYGDSSQSGTLRYITNKPDPTEFSAGIDTMLRTGSESSESYDVNGYVNIPVAEDKFALRLVGFSALDGGYIDNVAGVSPMQGTRNNASAVAEDINETEFMGGRVAAKWFVNDQWSVTGSYIYQKIEADSRSFYDPTEGDLQVVKFYQDSRDDEWFQLSLGRQPGHNRLQHQRSGERPLYAGVPALEDRRQLPLDRRRVLRGEVGALELPDVHAGFREHVVVLLLDQRTGLRSKRRRAGLVGVGRLHRLGTVGRVREPQLRVQRELVCRGRPALLRPNDGQGVLRQQAVHQCPGRMAGYRGADRWQRGHRTQGLADVHIC
jgi:hypothetical protein